MCKLFQRLSRLIIIFSVNIRIFFFCKFGQYLFALSPAGTEKVITLFFKENFLANSHAAEDCERLYFLCPCNLLSPIMFSMCQLLSTELPPDSHVFCISWGPYLARGIQLKPQQLWSGQVHWCLQWCSFLRLLPLLQAFRDSSLWPLSAGRSCDMLQKFSFCIASHSQ